MSSPLYPGIERRGHPRLALDLICHLQSCTTTHWKAAGRTVNISRSGVLVELERARTAPSPPPLGSRLRVDIELPARRILRCRGRLVRVVDSQGNGTLLAVAVERMEFRDQARKPVGGIQRARWSEVGGLLM